MRRAVLTVGVALVIGLGSMAQTPDAGPAMAPSGVEVRGDGHCPVVKAGDVVHYTLTLDGADEAQSVYADLQLRSRGGMKESDLPLPGSGAIGGGGAGTRDSQWGKVYHFAFTVPSGVDSGVYHAQGVMVTVRDASGASPLDAALDKKARERVHRFCLAVYGKGSGDLFPLVTDFKGGPIDKK
ncbi:hypothetical protein SAMN05421819_0213 [Bryocella elongata]|uniref:Uncharacterized protein n=1 Tax=Bryocella elongata TaxID=863522 RepID=A0A1H5SIQ0_9BACT|nr:hypothetical protein [Bryocella elongata]SEF50284.1 hypothetical protein SAMN05421819_0213 [Bryocella elongata]